MRQQGLRTIWLLLGLFCIATSTGQAQTTATQEQVPPPQAAAAPLAEFWEAIYLQGSHVGHSHGVYRPLRGNLIQSNEELHLSLTRFNQQMKMDFSFGMVENPAGKIQQFIIKQSMGRDDELVRVGVVDKTTVKITKTQGNQPAVIKTEPWNDEALGLYAMEQLYGKKELKPGLEFDFKTFASDFNTVLNYHVTVGEQQPTELLGGGNMPFWRIAVKLQKIGEVQLPDMICWVNDKGEVFKREQNIPGLGDLTFYRTRKERAIPNSTAVINNPGSDIGFSQLIRVNRAFNNFNQTKSVQYRVKLKDFKDIATAFARDARQEVKVVGKDELDLISRRQLPPPSGMKTNEKLPAEYLRSSHFITSDDPQVQRHARAATGTERDPWQKALMIETYVHRKMKNNDYGKAFATAAETAKTLDGDCTEHAVLAAAMCRVVGIPSRTAIGLIHVPSERAMCFHMWFEVWIDGKWYSLDATLGQGHIAGGHVKVIDAHWNDTDSFLPLLPVTSFLGKLKMDVLSVEYEANVPPR
ncbi:MAG: transglutaminase domain-containing protein [Gemmatales bacterium]